MPDSARQALVVLAASEWEDAPRMMAALAERGLSPEVLEPAREGGLITVDADRIRFTHPLVRSIAYDAASSEQQRSAHAALAEASSATSESRAWHLAYATAVVDEQVASGLEIAAKDYAARGALTTAARAADRAAELTPEVTSRAQRFLLGASLAQQAGTPHWAQKICQQGLEIANQPGLRAEFEHLAALIDRDAGSMLDARAQLATAANRIAADDPTIGSSILMDLVVADYMAGDVRAALRTAERASQIADSCPSDIRTLVAGMHAICEIYRGQRRLHDFNFMTVAGTLMTATELPPTMAASSEMLLMAWLVVGGHQVEPPRAEILNELIAARRGQGALSMLPWLLSAGAAIDLREDRWLRATARASEATELARHTDQGAALAWALYHQAWVEAFRSDEVPCRAHAAEALEIARALEVGSIEIYVAALLGVLESGLGNFRVAADHFDECARRAEESGLGQPEVIQYEPELVEAFVAAGRDPAVYAERLQRRAERTGSPWALATAARCRGLLADDTGIDSAFASALALHETLPSEFERARTKLCYGERLRRVRRNTDARQHLNEALTSFERLGARGWADRARRELHATGVSTGPRGDAGTFDELTPQELRVVLTVAGGATIREAAQHLFLSPKTIEAHLGRAYRKLGVRNRAEMATKVALLNHQALDPQLSYR
jgi:DNA-binding CsgD family transcriptional regulator